MVEQNKIIDSPDESPPKSSTSSKNKTVFAIGCGFLIICLLCTMALPFTFIFTLGAGMSGDLGQTVTELIIIGFLLNVIIVIVSGVIGVIVLSIWAIKKYLIS